MIKKNKIQFFYFIIISLIFVQSYPSENDSVTENIISKAQEQVATTLFDQIIPTNSIYESQIDTLYGTTDFNLSQQDLTHIKKFYCFFEFLIKLDKVQNDPKYQPYKNSFQSFITQLNDNKPTFPTQELVAHTDWKSVTITNQDFITNSVWQTCLKNMVCDSLQTIVEIINDTNEAKNQLSTYLAIIETAYPTQEYTQLRLYLESLELDYYLKTQQHQQYITQINDWKNLNQKDLINAINQFKKSNFYIYTHNLEKSKPTKNSQNGTNTYPIIPTPTQEEIICYFLFLHIQSYLETQCSTINIQTILANMQSTKIIPQLISYDQKDFIYIYDFLILKNMIETNKKNPIQTTVKITPAYDQQKNIPDDVQKTNQDRQAASNNPATVQDPQNQLIAKIFTKDFPTNSFCEKTVEAIYGTTGLNIAPDSIQKIKNTYCYLEFLVKLEMVTTNKKYAQYLQDFKPFIASSSESNVILPTQKLIDSAGWKAITITEKDLTQSLAWQNFLKCIICSSFDETTEYITNITEVNAQITNYLTNIEVSYHDDEYTQMRLYAESIQLYELLQTEQRSRCLQQSTDWKNLNETELKQAIQTFKNQPLYQAIDTDQNDQTTSRKNITPQIQNQLLAYVMLTTVQTDVYQTMTTTNLQSILQKSNTTLIPNFFMYQASDYIYMYDYLELTKLVEENKKTLQDSTDEENDTNNQTENNVIIQKTSKNIKKSNKATRKAFGKMKKDLSTAVKNMNTGFGKMGTGLATGFIEMSGGFAYGFVAIGGSKEKAEQAQDRTKKKMNAHKNALAKAFAVIIVNTVLFPFVPIILIAGIAFDKRVRNPIKETISAAFAPIMQGMAEMTDGMTTGFIEMSVGLTYAGCMIAVGLDPNAKINPKLEANKVRAKLEKYRMTLNIVMSVVIVVVVTAIVIGISIATAGAATPQFVLLEQAVINPMFATGQGATLAASSTVVGGELTFAGVGSVGVSTTVSSAAIGQAATTQAVTATSTASTTSSAITSTATPTFLSQLASQTIFDLGFILGQVLNAGFGVFTALGAVNQDKIAQMQKDQEQKTIQSLWNFVENSKIAFTNQQNSFSQELHKKHQISLENQAFGLQYYKNFLNGSVTLTQQQISQILSNQYIQILQPDENGLRIADIGSTWGLQTQFVYLYPSQGFITTTLGRPDFPYAQEVAQAPLVSTQNYNQQNSNSFIDKKPDTKLWFNQRAVTSLSGQPDQPLRVEIKFRIIYNLDTAYHVGLYLGGNYYDYTSPEYIQSLQTKNSIDTDTARLAKMFVLKRDDAKSSPSIGLYENEGKGWIIDEPVEININKASVYHMRATLNQKQLTISFWQEDNPSQKITKTVTVNPCDQRTFGIIFSGIAIEWAVVTPTLTITENQQVRGQFNGQKEIDRERASKAEWQKTMNPTLEFIKMQAVNKGAILQGYYLYTTSNTNLFAMQKDAMLDYVIFATLASDNSISHIGINPASTTNQANAIVSLVSGNIYNSSGQIVGQQKNIKDLYLQKNASLSTTIVNKINTSYTTYQQTLAPNQIVESQQNSLNSQTIALSDIVTHNTPITASSQNGLSNITPMKTDATSQTISKLQTQAAGNATIQISTNNATTVSSQTIIKNSSSPSTANTDEEFTFGNNAGFSL